MKTAKRLSLLLCALFVAAQPALAQNGEDTRNKAVMTTDDGERLLNTDEISIIRFDGPKVTVVQPWGETVFDRSLRNLTFMRPLPGMLRLTVTTALNGDDAVTRGLDINAGGQLAASWKAGDQVYVYPDATTTTHIGTLTPETTNAKTSKLTGDVTATGLTSGQTLYLSTKPRNHSFATQTNSLDDLFYYKAEATVTITGGNASIADASFSMAQSITRFTLQDGSSNAVNATKLVITGGTEDITVTSTPATNVFYVAMPAKASTVYSFTATTSDSREWTGTKTAALVDGKYYRATVTLTKTKLTVTDPASTMTTAVTAKKNGTANQSYTGSPLQLVTAGVSSAGTLKYRATTTNTKPSKSSGTWTTTVPRATAAGTYYVWYYAQGNDDYNATDVCTTPVTVTIDKAAMTGITATAYNAAYDGSAHGITVNNLPDGATVTYSEDGTTYQADNYTYTDVTTAQTVHYKVSKANYDDFTSSSTVTITQAANSFTTQPTITDWTFGEAANTPTGGEAEFGTSTITYKYCATADGDYDTYESVVNGNAGPWFVKGFVEATTNYAAAESDAISFTIANATMTGITATAYNAAYDGSAHGITVNDVPAGATVTYSEDGENYREDNYTYTDVADVRTVHYKVSKANYDDFTGSSTVTITQATNSFTTQPTITGWTFGEAANTPTGGEAEFGTSTITYKYCATADGDYDTYESVVNGNAGPWFVKGFVEATTNYAAAESDAISFTIANATMTGITATAYNAAYDGTAHGITVNGVPEGAIVTYSTDGENYQAANYTYTDVTTAQTVHYKVSKANYDDFAGSSTVTITQAANSFTTQPTIAGWTYGEAANTPTGGEAEFGTSAITYKYCATADGDYDTYESVVNGAAGTWFVKGFVEATTNYAAAESDAVSFTIANATMTGITATAYNAAYDGAAHGITVNGVPEGATVTYSTDGENYQAANYTYTDVTTAQTVHYKVSKANYDDFAGSSTVTINKKTVTVSGITAANKTYDGTATATLDCSNPTFDGIIDGDILTITATGHFTDVNVGTNKDVALVDLTLGGTSEGNYQLAGEGNQQTAKANITAAAITPVATMEGWTYGGVAQSPIVSGNTGHGAETPYYKSGESEWTTTQPTNAGTYQVKVYVAAEGNYAAAETEPVEFTIAKAAPTYTPPAYSALTYTGGAQNLVSVGTSDHGTFTYSTTQDGTYTSTIPQGTDAGDYTVWYKFTGDANHNDVDATEVTDVSIAQASNSFTAQPTISGWTYGTEANTPTGGEAVFGTSTITYKYSDAENGTYGTYESVVKGDAGTWFVKSFVDATANYAAATSNAVSFTIAPAASAVTTPPTGKTGLTYNGSAQELVDATNAGCTGGTLVYSKTEDGSYEDASTITETAAGTYSFYYKVQADGNHTDSEPVQVTVSIAKANAMLNDAPAANTLTYTGSAQALVTEGTASNGTVQYKLGEGGYSTDVPTATNAGDYTVYYKVVGNTNYNDVAEASVSVTINKAAATLTCSNTAISFSESEATNSTKTRSASCTGGTISVSGGSNSTIAASYSSGTITLTRKTNSAVSSTTITVSVTPDGNHTAPSNVTFNVSATAYDTGVALSASSVGDVVATDALCYPAASFPAGKTKAGVVVYKSGSSGLVVSLTNLSSKKSWTQIANSSDNPKTLSSHTPAVSGKSWVCGTKTQYSNMWGGGSGCSSWSDFNTKITNAGGTALGFDSYWSCTEGDSGRGCLFYNGSWGLGHENSDIYVRPLFAF